MRRPALLGLAAFALAACQPRTAPSPASASYDVVIVNGKIMDGTGNPWYYGDVGIAGDRIAFVGPRGSLATARATHRVDATGHAVSPGFIDIQSHSWDQLLWRDGRVVGKVTQGVTTEILGESTTPAPVNDEIMALLEIPDTLPRLVALHQTFRGPRGFAAWLAAMEDHPNSVNVGSYLGASTVRAYAMGQRQGAPNAAELDTMRMVVRNAMEDGAFGISTALIYPPGAYATTRELVEMAKAMAPYHGTYITHMRSEDDSLFEAMDEAFRIGREGGVPVDIYHLKASERHNWPKAARMVWKIDSARASGLDVAATMYPYAASGNGLSSCFPDWAHEGGRLLANLRDPATRARIVADLERTRTCNPERSSHAVIGFQKPELKKHEGKLIADIMREMGKSSAETVIELTLAENGQLGKINFSMSEENVAMQLRKPWVIIGSDAGGHDPDSARGLTHPRAYGSYPRVLGRYARQDSLFTMEEAVRRMTGAVAARLQMKDRGLLREGLFADLAIWDPATIIDHATFEKPHQLSTGVKHVLVNGEFVLRDGRHTGATPGRVVRGIGYER
ncbi:MAG TPA: D-aminoacylase [Gemmatimonadaceae bacterium]|nr:D-aminoacylase [Gemmatimonadaceae bacterium]